MATHIRKIAGMLPGQPAAMSSGEEMPENNKYKLQKKATSTQICQQETPGDISAMPHTPQCGRDAQLANKQ